MRVAVEKLPGIASAEVSLNEGMMDVQLESDNGVTVAELRRLIREQGFTPRAALIRATGTVTTREGEVVLVLPRSGQELVLEGPDVARHLAQADGTPVTVEGLVPADSDGVTPDRVLDVELPSGR